MFLCWRAARILSGVGGGGGGDYGIPTNQRMLYEPFETGDQGLGAHISIANTQ